MMKVNGEDIRRLPAIASVEIKTDTRKLTSSCSHPSCAWAMKPRGRDENGKQGQLCDSNYYRTLISGISSEI